MLNCIRDPAGRTQSGSSSRTLGCGASHDSSRIIWHSYHTAEYVELAKAGYRDWSTLEADAGEGLDTATGGLDLYPPAAVISPAPYLAAMRQAGTL